MVTVKELSSSIAGKVTVPLLIGASLTGAKLKELDPFAYLPLLSTTR